MRVPIVLIAILTSSIWGQEAGFRFNISPKAVTECACARDLTFRVSSRNSLWQPSSVTIWAKQVDGNWIQIGTLNDNGQNGDETAGDGHFGLAASYSVPFIGSTAIEARVVVNGQTQTAQVNFSVVKGIAVSDDGSLKGLSADGVNSLWFDSSHPDATRFILDRAASSSGTWNQLESRDFPASKEAHVTGKMWDESTDASTHDWFYRIRSFNSSGSLLETYEPVFIRAYRGDGWDLCFDQTASSWTKCTAQAAPPKERHP